MGISNTANEVLTQFKNDVFLVRITQHLTKIILHYKKEQESLFYTLCTGKVRLSEKEINQLF